MNFKKILFHTIIIFIVCSIFHFGYEWVPSFLTSLFFPVNESVFEHLKMIFTATCFFSLISNFFYHDKNILFKTYLRSMTTIIILLILYLPINYLIGENMITTFIILFISIFLSEMICSRISVTKEYSLINKISLILLILNFVIFAICTYYPPKMELFLDEKYNQYGIKIPK